MSSCRRPYRIPAIVPATHLRAAALPFVLWRFPDALPGKPKSSEDIFPVQASDL